MSGPQFSRPGAVDLSALQPGPTATAGKATGAYVVEITDEQSLATEVVNRSMTAVVVLSVWSPDVAASVQLNDTLTALADEFAGRFLLATLDARANPELVSAIGIPSVPLVAAALRGQLAPLFQEALPEPEMRAVIQQILQAATANGITGTVEARTPAAAPEASIEPLSRFPEAEDALMDGDVDSAISQYEAALAKAPADAEAAEGLARAHLLKRTAGVDLAGARAAAADAPDNVDAQMMMADLDLLGGHVDDAFGRLLELLRRSSGDDRDAVRKHLLDLFAVVGDADPRVGKARRSLTAALF